MLTKMVNGIEVECSADEEAGILAEWDQNSQPPTPAEIDAENDAVFDNMINQNKSIIKAFILCINDGSIVPSGNATPAELKAAIKSKL